MENSLISTICIKQLVYILEDINKMRNSIRPTTEKIKYIDDLHKELFYTFDLCLRL